MSTAAPGLRPFSRSLPMALLKAREAAMRLFRPSLSAHGLTEQQWRVLRALDTIEEIDVGGLAAITYLLAPSLTRILRDLEKRRLIRRRIDPNDRRAALIALRSEGRRALAIIGRESEATYALIEARLGKDALDALMTMLAEVEVKIGPPTRPTPVDSRSAKLSVLSKSAGESLGCRSGRRAAPAIPRP